MLEDMEEIECSCPACGCKMHALRYKNLHYSEWKVPYCEHCKGIIFLSQEERDRVRMLLTESNHIANGFYNDGIAIHDVIVHRKRTEKVCFNASIKICFSGDYFYRYNDHKRWMGIFETKTHDRFLDSLTLVFRNKSQEFEQLFKLMHGLHMQNSVYTIETCLPDEMILDDSISVSLRQINYIDEEVEFEDDSVENDNRHYLMYCEKYKSELDELREAMSMFPIRDAESYVKDFERTPEIIKDITLSLIAVKSEMDNFKPVFPEDHLFFRVRKTYDKRYFIAAKIADSAFSVSEEIDSYVLEFTAEQANEISLLYNLYTPNGLEFALSESCDDARKYLQKIDRGYYIASIINQKREMLWKKYKHYLAPNTQVLWNVLGDMNKKEELEELYNSIAKEGRLNVRWNNEYRLFRLISEFVQNVVYQYKPEWLAPQSLDMYLPDYNVGIEYQGKQHYKSIDFFGGVEALMENKRRDQKKKAMCRNNGVRLLEWKYTTPVNINNLLQFMKDNGISYSANRQKVSASSTNMAPVKDNQRRRKKRSKQANSIRPHIIQIDEKGDVIRSYKTIKEAAQTIGVSSTSISKAIRGERKKAGGYAWKIENI